MLMADVQKLQDKVAKSKIAVDKKMGTIERHRKQLDKKKEALGKLGLDVNKLSEIKESMRGSQKTQEEYELYWKLVEVERKEEDIVGAKKKYVETVRIYENWQDKLNEELRKEEFLLNAVPQVIHDFLNEWERMSYDWYIRRYNSAIKLKVDLELKKKEAHDKLGIGEYRRPTREQAKQLKEMGLDSDTISGTIAEYAGGTVLSMMTMRSFEKADSYIKDALAREKKTKTINLMKRITDVVGEIKNMENLKVSSNGNLDGIVRGSVADAKIETIGAGGFNIQCFHFRTLVHKIK
jgi:hypothetical protein